MVVTSDREIQAWAQGVGAAWITAGQFEMQHLLAPGAKPGRSPTMTGPRRLKKGPAHRLPKAQRRRQQRLKKL